MRIGLLTTSFPRHAEDIAGHFVLGFANALAARGHTLEVLAPEPTDSAPGLALPGLTVHWVPYLRPRALQRTFYGAGVPDNLRRDPRAWVGIAPFIAALSREVQKRRRRWDATCSHWALPCGLIGAGLATGRPHLTVVHSADLHLLGMLPGRRALASRLIANANTLSFVSQAQRARFLGWLAPAAAERAAPRCHVQAMGIDPLPAPTETRAALRARLGLHRFSVLCLSRLLPVKGLDVAIRACASEPDIELLIAGDGPERMRLQSLARRLAAPVRFLGLCTGSRKLELLHAVDAYACSSRRLVTGRTEGMPTALLEAQAAGLPSLASDVGGIREHVETSALLVPPDDPHALRLAMRQLRDDHALRVRLSEAASRVGRAHHWPVIAPRIEGWLGAAR